MLVRLFLVFAAVINIPCKDGEDVEDMEVSGSEASEGLCPESTSNSDCGECCGGHAPHPTLSMSPRSPNIIPGRDSTRSPVDPIPRGPGHFFTPRFPDEYDLSLLRSPPIFLEVPEKAISWIITVVF